MSQSTDIPVPPPRTPKYWVCLKCGDKASPEPGQMDERYQVGYCDCTPGRKSRVSGYHREMVVMIPDFRFDRYEWELARAREKEKKAFDKQQGGMPLTPEEVRLAAKWRARQGLPE